MQNHSTSPIKPLVRPSLYAGIAVLSVINVATLALTRADILTAKLPMFFLQGLLFLALFVAARRLLTQAAQPAMSLVRLHYIVEGLFFLHIAWLNLRLLNHLSMMVPFPYADRMLANWDQALNLNWLAYFNAVLARPLLLQIFDFAYTSLTLLSLAVLVLMVAFGYVARAREFIETFLITAVACILIGAAFPAEAAVMTLFPDLSVFEQMGAIPGSYHIAYMKVLRDPSAAVMLDPDRMPGLATFPSFHTASGILIVSACRSTWLSVPAWAYSIVMIASTPVHGGHYFVDLIAGTFIALVSIWLVTRVHRKNDASIELQRPPVCAAAQPSKTIVC